MKIETPENYEARAFVGTVEVRKREGGGAIIAGMAAIFDTLSENLGGFREIIEPGAFDKTDMSDVRGLFNHDANFVLGRNIADTLRLKTTANGLSYEIDAPDTPTINDLVIGPIERGDVNQSSFGFIVGMGNDTWAENDDGVLIRTIHRIRELFDVAPVTFAAYEDTTAGVRSMNAFVENRTKLAEQAQAEIDERKSRVVALDALDRRVQMPGA